MRDKIAAATHDAAWDETTDVVVIGGGLAGHCAALAAAEAGARVWLIEKQPQIGGSTVLDVFGEPIAGLYAAGEMTGGFHGVAYMTGTSLGKCTVFGRIAGRNAAARNAA